MPDSSGFPYPHLQLLTASIGWVLLTRKYSHIPGPKPAFLTGNIPDVTKLGKGIAWYIKDTESLGHIFRLFVG